MSSIYQKPEKILHTPEITGMAFGDLWSQLAIIFMVATAITLPLLIYTLLAKTLEMTEIQQSLDQSKDARFATLIQKDIQKSKERENTILQLQEQNRVLEAKLQSSLQQANEYKSLILSYQEEIQTQQKELNTRGFLVKQGNLRITALRNEVDLRRKNLHQLKYERMKEYHILVTEYLTLKAKYKRIQTQVQQPQITPETSN